MKLTYLPQWKVQNNSKKQFVIQEDEASISIVSPINEYAMGILSQVTFSTTNGVVTEATVENILNSCFGNHAICCRKCYLTQNSHGIFINWTNY